MVRISTRSPRKKPEKPAEKKDGNLISWLQGIALTGIIWLLVGFNLIFIVSMFFQVLKAGSGEEIEGSQKIITADRMKQDMVRVEILNGCGEDRVAAKLRDYLVTKKFNVVDFKNYKRWDIPQTMVIDRQYMDKRNARTVADAVGVKNNQILPQLSSQKNLDVSIIIGKDFKSLKAFE